MQQIQMPPFEKKLQSKEYQELHAQCIQMAIILQYKVRKFEMSRISNRNLLLKDFSILNAYFFHYSLHPKSLCAISYVFQLDDQINQQPNRSEFLIIYSQALMETFRIIYQVTEFDYFLFLLTLHQMIHIRLGILVIIENLINLYFYLIRMFSQDLYHDGLLNVYLQLCKHQAKKHDSVQQQVQIILMYFQGLKRHLLDDQCTQSYLTQSID